MASLGVVGARVGARAERLGRDPVWPALPSGSTRSCSCTSWAAPHNEALVMLLAMGGVLTQLPSGRNAAGGVGPYGRESYAGGSLAARPRRRR